MSVKIYSLKKDRNTNITPNFKVKEFRCMDGSDKILISSELVRKLEILREDLHEEVGGVVTISINSGYRTPAHNKKVGGSSASKHLKGIAADITCKKDGKTISAKTVCCIAQNIFNGVAYINESATHVDDRSTRWWADETKGNKRVSDFYPYFGKKYPEPNETVKKGDKGTTVRWVQDKLKKAGYKVSVDGVFGAGTLSAVKKLQRNNRLIVDGKVGVNTRKILNKF